MRSQERAGKLDIISRDGFRDELVFIRRAIKLAPLTPIHVNVPRDSPRKRAVHINHD